MPALTHSSTGETAPYIQLVHIALGRWKKIKLWKFYNKKTSLCEGKLHVDSLERHDKPGVYLEREGRELSNSMNLFYCFTGSLVSLWIKSEDFSLPCQTTLHVLDVNRPEHAVYTCVCVHKILRSGHAVYIHTCSHRCGLRAREDTPAVLVLNIPFS